jgi:hypothetical protein
MIHMSAQTKHTVARVLRWGGFGVLCALIPVFYGWWQGGTALDHVIARGEVFVVTGALAAAAMGEMFGPDAPKGDISRAILPVMCILILLMSVLAFADAAELDRDPAKVASKLKDDQFVSKQAHRSLALLIAVVVTGGAVMAVTAGPSRKKSSVQV